MRGLSADSVLKNTRLTSTRYRVQCLVLNTRERNEVRGDVVVGTEDTVD